MISKADIARIREYAERVECSSSLLTLTVTRDDWSALCDAAERGAEVTEEVSEIVKGWRESVRDCDDDVGDVVREFADSIEAALGIDRPTPEEAGE